RGKDGGGEAPARPPQAPVQSRGRLFALSRFAGAALLSLGFVTLAGAAPVLVTENPRGTTDDQTALDAPYGVGKWTLYNSYSSAALDVSSIFNGSTRFVFLEGSADTDQNLSSFLGANAATILSWVNAGGNLLLQSAGWDTSISFGNVTLNYGNQT